MSSPLMIVHQGVSLNLTSVSLRGRVTASMIPVWMTNQFDCLILIVICVVMAARLIYVAVELLWPFLAILYNFTLHADSILILHG